MNTLKELPWYKQAMVNLITANANYMRDEIIANEKDLIKKEEMLDKLKSDTKERLLNILLK